MLFRQVPGYITSYDAFKAKGVNGIYIVAVNDAFVTQYVAFVFPHLSISLNAFLSDMIAEPGRKNLHLKALKYASSLMIR